jgi:hypothetical protein
MKPQEAQALLGSLCSEAEKACTIAKIAARNKKSLAGVNPYADRFHNSVVAISTTEAKLRAFLAGLGLDGQVEDFESQLALLKSTDAKPPQRAASMKQLKLICQSVLSPRIEATTASPVPATEQVLPMDLVHKTRPYLEKILQQANGCYERAWYDACSVMIRRFVETLIIEVYEHQNRAAYIKDAAGDYLMLRNLVDKILNDLAFNLGRETKKGLPLIKSLGDRSAHTRYYIARKADVDPAISPLRVVAEELLHLGGIR